MTEKIDLKNLDKSTWQKVKFSDIAINVRKTSKNPLKDGFTKAIGLGHIEPDNLNLLGYTDIAKEGTKFNKIFRKGQFLFGSRRAYLRQMARATFDGVCTANIMVFDVKDENLINRDLFEFIIRSDSFINCAINTSEGSLFPNAKWKYIAEYEFLLPPKDQQAQLAKLLWAMDEVIEQQLKLEKDCKTTYLSIREELISKGDFPRKPLVDLVDKLITYGIVQPGENLHEGIPYIQSSDIKESAISEKLAYTSYEIAAKYKRSEVKSGDIIFSLRGNLGDTAIVPEGRGEMNMARGVARISLKNEYDNLFIKYALESRPILSKILAVSQGSTFKEVSLDTLRKIKVPVPETLKAQKEISHKLSLLFENRRSLAEQIESSKMLQKSLINQVF